MNIVAANASTTKLMVVAIGYVATKIQSITQITQHITIAVLKQRIGSRTNE